MEQRTQLPTVKVNREDPTALGRQNTRHVHPPLVKKAVEGVVLSAGQEALDPPSGNRRPVMFPNKFDGVSSWSDYLIHFESVATVNQWGRVEKATFLASHLEGSAQEALADMEPTAQKEYSCILAYFEKRFGVTAWIQLYRV